MVYRFLIFILKIALRVYYGRIEMEGRENVPATGPVLLTLNHPNALIDPLVVAIELDRELNLTAKSTLLKMPLIGTLMRLGRVVPIYRQQDKTEGADPSKNVDSLAECRRRLEEGGALCIFPEGQSHSDPQLRPLKTGAARIALEYVESNGNKGGLKIVPTGLHFEQKERLRSRVWIRFGEPLDPAAWREAHPGAGAKELTHELNARLRQQTLNFENDDESDLLSWTASVLMTGGAAPPPLNSDGPPLAERQKLIQTLREGYATLKTSRADEILAIENRARAYRAELEKLDVTPGEVFLSLSATRAAAFTVREILRLLILLPLALYGLVHNFLPWIVVRLIGSKLTQERDQWASNVIFPSLVIFPVFHLAQTIAMAFVLPPVATVIYAITLPFSAIIALHARVRGPAVLRRTRTFLKFVFHPTLQKRLRDEGREIIAAIQALNTSA